MPQQLNIRIDLDQARQEDILEKEAASSLNIDRSQIKGVRILRKSIDARKARVKFDYKVEVYINEELPEAKAFDFDYKDVTNAKAIHIIGFGPAGMFAALRAIELGFKPVVFERGKQVQERRRDLKLINQDHLVNEDSNYCFGEGGAGTYSDGKLYTRSLKRGDVRRVFENFVFHGAPEQILIDAHPHIGTDKLPKVVERIRSTVLKYGGEIHFGSRVSDFKIKDKRIVGIELEDGRVFECEHVVLATGHSARDIFQLLHDKGIAIKAKSFAMGVRIEHPQDIIDQVQYHCKDKRDPLLPAAAYNLTHQVNGRGVYSFCMCPGGFIVPAATAPGEVVVNGMSPSKRNNEFANSGIVVEINAETDLFKYESHGEMKGLAFQKDLERLAFQAGGKSQTAPAQRMLDFVEGVESTKLNPSSYQPGLKSVSLHSILPKMIGGKLRKGLKAFGEKMPAYFTNEANVIGVESRTSSPVSIPRDDKYEHPEIKGLYPCGEGGGYAGGIVSAAMDGEKVVNSIVECGV